MWGTFGECEAGHLSDRIVPSREQADRLGVVALVLLDTLGDDVGAHLCDECGAPIMRLLPGDEAFIAQMRRDYQSGHAHGQSPDRYEGHTEKTHFHTDGHVDEVRPVLPDRHDYAARCKRYGYHENTGSSIAGYFRRTEPKAIFQVPR